MGLELEKLVVIVIAAFALGIAIFVVKELIFGANDGTNVYSRGFAGDLFKKEYVTNLKSEFKDGKITISYDLKNPDDIQPPRIYYVSNPDGFVAQDVREPDLSPTKNNPDFKGSPDKTTNSFQITPKLGVSKISIVVFDNNEKVAGKKEMALNLYNQEYIDKFNKDLSDSSCSALNKCNVISCKTSDVTYTSIPRKNDALKLKEDELFGLTKSANSKCTTKTIYLAGFPSPGGPTIVQLDRCTPDEVYTIFENALNMKADQAKASGDARAWGAVRDDIYQKTFAGQCVDALRSWLNNNQWSELK